MNSNQTFYMNPRKLYTQTLCADPYWRGPYLAVALLFGNQTGQNGNGFVFLSRKNALAVGFNKADVDRIADALDEQGYISLLDDPEDGAYRLSAIRPATDLASPAASAESRYGADGSATRWLGEETRAWLQFQAQREARRQRAENAENAA
jgi:hypothetical protein